MRATVLTGRSAVWGGIVMLTLLPCASCSPDPHSAASLWLKWSRAKDFFADPLQARLAHAVARGDIAGIDAAVRDGADVNAKGTKGIPLLVWAMAKGSVPGFEALLAHGADLTALVNDPHHTTVNGHTPKVIEAVVAASNPAFLRAALTSGFDPDYMPSMSAKESLLFVAVWTHAIDNAAILLEAGANIDHRDSMEQSAVLLAQGMNYFEMIVFLLRHGADPHIKDRWGYDLVASIKKYHDIGPSNLQNPAYAKVIAEMKARGLITDDELADAVKQRELEEGGRPRPGITVIEHPPDSDAGRAIQEMDRREREANDRNRR